MASSDLTLEQIYQYFKENGNVVKNRELVHHFKPYLTNSSSKDDARVKFKRFVNTLAQTKTENNEKLLYLKTRYLNSLDAPRSPLTPCNPSTFIDPRNSLGIPVSPSSHSISDCSPAKTPTLRQPPPYRAPPPVASPSPSCSLDNISLCSIMSQSDSTPQPPPRRKGIERQMSLSEEATPRRETQNEVVLNNNGEEKQTVSVKERMEKFNRMASVEDEPSPSRLLKSIEKNKKGADGASVTSLEPKKCVEWCVTASKGDLHELVKLAKDEPRLVNRKDPFTAYTVLHWGAKHGNPEIIKMFAGRYNVDVDGKTNGGYTPLHLAAQFGHKEIFILLQEVYKADKEIRDYNGRKPDFYFKTAEQKERNDLNRKIKGRKKQSEKDLGFLRIGSLNVRVKKTTEAFSNFLGVGSGSINPLETMTEKVQKGWGSADNVNQENSDSDSKATFIKKKTKRPYSSGLNSMPGTPKQAPRNVNPRFSRCDSDSDTAAGFDSQWKD